MLLHLLALLPGGADIGLQAISLLLHLLAGAIFTTHPPLKALNDPI